MAIFMSREGTWPEELANVFTSSLPRADQRPCSTQNESIGMRPDFGGSSRLTIKVRSCWPPFTMSPAWMKTGSLPLFSISSWLTLPVSRTSTVRLANASSSVSGALPGADVPWMKKTVRFSWITGPEMRTGSDDGAAAKAASADRTNGEAERAASNDQRIWESPVRRRRAGKFHRLMAGMGSWWPKFDMRGEKSGG
jgi:hypothetical protein